ncbi:MAG: universal stress protein [Burkholderiales bacterium]|nr:universal stress protein [Burkholderiales bacterium]
MQKILIAIDDSPSALRAVDHVIRRLAEYKAAPELHLINAQLPVHGGVSSFVDATQLKQLHQEEGSKALAAAQARLDGIGVAHHDHIFVGDPAEVIARHANEQAYDEVVMGTRGHNPISNMLLGSVSTKLLHLANMPVTLVK